MVDLIVMGGAAAARNGLTALPVNGGETFFKVNQTNYLVAEENLTVIAAIVQTGAIANLAQSRFKRTDANDWNDLGNAGRDQTGAYTTDIPARLTYPLPAKKQLQAEINNGNNSQVDQIGIFLAKSPGDKIFFGGSGMLADLLADGYELVRFTGATTVTAGLWSDVTLTAITWVPDNGVKYHIGGMLGWGATGMWGRLRHRKGGTQDIRPGFLIGDDASPPVMNWTFQDFGEFVGDSFPVVEHISVAADTAQEYLALVKRMG